MPHNRRSLLILSVCSFALLGAAGPDLVRPTRSPEQQANSLTSGDALFAEGRLPEAAVAYERAVTLDPKSGTSLAALARMRLYQHREREAADLARRALAVMPDNVLAAQVLRSVEARSKAFGTDVYRVSGPVTEASATFVTTDPLPVVRVRVGNRDASFVLDTGAPDIAVSRAFAASLGLPLTQGGVGTFAGGQHAPVERTVVPELEIGGIRVSHVPAVISPADLQLPGVHTDGVIGTGFLMHFLSTLDYCSGKLLLARRTYSAAFERRAAAGRANIVPMWLVGDHFIFARGSINQVEGLFSIDTGLAGGGLVATKPTIDAAGIKLEGDKVRMGEGGGGPVPFLTFKADAALGKLARPNVPGVYMTGGDPFGMFPFKVAGALSHSFFRQSRVTFDFEAMRMITQEC